MARKRVASILCKVCGSTLPQDDFFKHVQIVHEMYMEEYERKYGTKKETREIVIEDPEAPPVEMPHVTEFKTVKESLEPAERKFWDQQEQHLLDTYDLDDPHFREQILFLMLVNRRKQISYTTMVGVGSVDDETAENMTKQVQKNSESIVQLLQKFLDMRMKFELAENVAALHTQTMEEAEQFIKDNVGTFSFGCNSCGEVVNSEGLPHWAIWKKDDATGARVYYIWSDELWFLYANGIIPLHVMAFILRTSPNNLWYTADKRMIDHEMVRAVRQEYMDTQGEFSDTLAKEEDVLKGLRQRFVDEKAEGVGVH